VEYNDLFGNGIGNYRDYETLQILNTAEEINSLPEAEGNQSQDPLFVDDANNDFHLQAASPSIDAGDNEGAPGLDFDGDIRPLDGDDDSVAIVDIGADEYVPNYAPTANAGGPYAGGEGSEMFFDASASSDPDEDALQYRWDFDSDGAWDTDWSDSPTATHTWDDDWMGYATVMVSDGVLTDTATATVTVDNVAPTANFGAPASVNEDGDINLSLTDPFDPSSADTATGFEYAFDCGDGSGFGAFSPNNTAICPTDDNGMRTVRGQIRDKDGGATSYEANVTINNVAPTVDNLTVPVDPININDQAVYSVDVTFSDPAGAYDEPYTCVFDMDYDGVTFDADATVSGVTGMSCSTPLNYTDPGVYTVRVDVTDKDGGTGSATAIEYIVVYDPEGAFVTGGGWIDSPEGAYTADPSLSGRANFGFVSKYQQGTNVPTGNTEFNLKAGNLNFHSDAYEWLVVNQGGTNAQYKGTGTINGDLAPNGEAYKFMVWAGDGDPDTFRIKMWYEEGESEVAVYDNGFDQAIGGGNIKIHD
jgi:hypothetical protein